MRELTIDELDIVSGGGANCGSSGIVLTQEKITGDKGNGTLTVGIVGIGCGSGNVYIPTVTWTPGPGSSVPGPL